MSSQSSPPTGWAVILGNNQTLLNSLSELFSRKNINLLPPHDLKIFQANYFLFVINPSHPLDQNQVRQFVSFLNQTPPLDSKFALIIQNSNLIISPSNNHLINKIQNQALTKDLNFRTIHVWDLISSQPDSFLSPLDQLIKSAFINQKISVSLNGDLKLYPLSLNDFFDGLARSLFLHKTNTQTFTFGGTSISDLDLALKLKTNLAKTELDLEITQDLSFPKNLPNPQPNIDQTSAKINWQPAIEVETVFSQLVKNRLQIKSPPKPKIRPSPISPPPKIPLSQTVKTAQFRWLFKLLFLFITASASIFLLSFASFFLVFSLSLKQTNLAYQKLQSGEIDQVPTLLHSSNRRLDLSQKLYPYVLPAVKFIHPLSADSINSSLLLISHTNQALKNLHHLYLISQNFYQDSVSGVSLDTQALATSLNAGLQAFQTEVNQILLLKQSLPASQLFASPNLDQKNLDRLKTQIYQAVSLTKILPHVFPPNKLTHYLLIIQDNNEYRPSGGFLNTYALLSFNGNKLVDLQVKPALHLNSLLQGTVSSPSQISRLTGESNWTFTDSNYFPNFPETAQQISWFTQKAINLKPDGLISLNLSLFENFLKHQGPIKLATGQEITAANLRLILSNPTQEEATDLLTLLSSHLLSQFKSKKINPAALFRATLDALASSDINLWFSNPSAQKLIQTTNLSGALNPVSCPPQFASLSCLAETIYFNEANYSINKSNFYQHRAFDYQVNIDNQGNINHQLKVNYSYPTPAPTTSNTQYKALIRLYLPQASLLSSITLDQQKIDQTQILSSNKYGLIEYEFPLSYSLNQNHLLTLAFSSGNKLNLTGPSTTYSLNLIKQPGIANSNQTVTLNHPRFLNPQLLSLPANTSRQSVSFSSLPASTSTYATNFSVVNPSSN